MLNAQAQRIVTVINAVPRDLAIVIKQIGDKIPAAPAKPRLKSRKLKRAAEEAASGPGCRSAGGSCNG